MEQVTERVITSALKERHKKRGDYFASQVKMGSFGNKILDGIAIPITWSPRTIIGYEIKVSKYDFLNDQKYPHYMSTCNLFYFVVPKGLITNIEVPDSVGILEYSNGNLRQIKKAVYRIVEINTDMLLHCIFYKVSEYNRPLTRQEHLDNIKAKVEAKEYGTKISDKIKQFELKSILGRNNKDEGWEYFQKEFKQKYGFEVTPYNVSNYISLDNKKHNEAIRLLRQAAELFEVKDNG